MNIVILGMHRSGTSLITGILNKAGFFIGYQDELIGSNAENPLGFFERKDIRRVEVNEGEIVYEGRFGNSIKLGCDHTNNTPVIKIRAGQQTLNGEIKDVSGKPVKESIDNDASSIYLISDGLVGETFEEEQITGKKILIKSDGIFIKGSGEKGEVRIIGDESINLNSDKIKLGNDANQPVVKGNDLKKLLDQVFQGTIDSNKALITQNLAEVTIKTNAGLLADAAKLIKTNIELQSQNKQLGNAITKGQYLSNKVKTT